MKFFLYHAAPGWHSFTYTCTAAPLWWGPGFSPHNQSLSVCRLCSLLQRRGGLPRHATPPRSRNAQGGSADGASRARAGPSIFCLDANSSPEPLTPSPLPVPPSLVATQSSLGEGREKSTHAFVCCPVVAWYRHWRCAHGETRAVMPAAWLTLCSDRCREMHELHVVLRLFGG